MVIGMGEDKTPPPFRKACDIFTVLELLLEDSMLEKPEKAAAHAVVGKESKKESAGAVSKSQIEEAVVKIITENQNNDKETGLGEVGSRLVKLYPDFDVRNFGSKSLNKFLTSLAELEVEERILANGNPIQFVRVKPVPKPAKKPAARRNAGRFNVRHGFQPAQYW